MEIKRRLAQKLAEVREFSFNVREKLLGEQGVLTEYLNVWVPDKAALTLKQAEMLLEEFQQEADDLERIKRNARGCNLYVPQMANELMKRHGEEGVERFSNDLLRLMGLEDKYDVFPFNDFDRVFKEYAEALPLPIQNLFTELSNVSNEQLSEMVEMSFEREEDGFTFSENSLIVLNGLLVVKKILVEALGHFEFYVTKKEEFRDFLRDVCLDYYNNTITGNPVRKYSKKEEELPESVSYDEEDSINKKTGFWGLGIGAAMGALTLSTFMSDDVGGIITFSFILGGVGWLIGRLMGRSIVRTKNHALGVRYRQIKEANAAEDKRWRAEVIKEFNKNAGDLEYFNSVVDSLIGKLDEVDTLLTTYIQESFFFIPEKYRFDDLAVATFYDYVKDKRVETIQQTVNLYVSEQRLEEFRQKQLMNQQAILRAQDLLIEENQRKNALLEKQVAQQKQLERKLTDLKTETQKLGEIEQKKTEELSKLKDNVEDIKIEINKLT